MLASKTVKKLEQWWSLYTETTFRKWTTKKSTNCYNKVEGWKHETFKRGSGIGVFPWV